MEYLLDLIGLFWGFWVMLQFLELNYYYQVCHFELMRIILGVFMRLFVRGGFEGLDPHCLVFTSNVVKTSLPDEQLLANILSLPLPSQP